MTDITELPSKWRGSRPNDQDFNVTSYGAMGAQCADELEEALPIWTQVTPDKSTWPDKDLRVFCAESDSDSLNVKYFNIELLSFWMGDHWRPLCALDYPPKQNKDQNIDIMIQDILNKE